MKRAAVIYESLFRSEMTVEHQKKYDELKAAGSFSFRGPPPISKRAVVARGNEP